MSGEAARQAMVFQRPVLLRRSVRANLRFALSAAGYARQTRFELAEKWMHQGQLAHLADQPARRLSGGEQQRLSLVRALCCNPEILFLDEPCAHLDVNAAQHVEALINSAIEAGIKVVMITHDRAQARRLGGEILLMEGGQVKAQEGAALFFGSSQNLWTQAFLQGYKVSDTEAET
jgi:tungstate transport system ATP-binding protein